MKEDILKVIQQQGVLPLYFNSDKSISIGVLQALYQAGIRAVEYTNRGEAAFDNFKALVQLRNTEMPDMFLGIGTLKNRDDAEKYTRAGADFLISPGFVSEIAGFAQQEKILYAPGCMTPSEIIAAENSGVGFIKLFPGNMLGPGFMSGIRDIFPNLLFMPTGGVDTTAESIKSWLDAGVCAVGMGSKLVSKSLMEQKDYATIKNNTKQVIDIIKSIRG
ncbi:bifunctional 4-hydroxy-2-oxoglutarate aldolase/2-dehydro-3-deoxy-phosphogluconate aldolase [Flavobacterium rhizosphaerae]|uniref:Bifunctional 4-hydroxy-2-oxoglutarate aldolase/2-dehydro-3-deoxy-phosphogluconate aldolase n=1 Tax=Flavobacterium rhizosphaerae TaxID=3163298 RepID=A0ABW8YT18_9FLAO